MGILKPGSFHNINECGMTLIEVLIALAIVSIGMTAIIKAASQNIRGTQYLQDKTEAMWVATNVINQFRAGTLSFNADDKSDDKVNMLGKDWYYKVEQAATPNKHIQKITVSVAEHEQTDDTLAPTVTLSSYLYDN